MYVGDKVNVNQVSVRSANSAGLVTSSAILELWQLHGLDISNPMTVTQTERSVGTIHQDITGDGDNTSIVTRDT